MGSDQILSTLIQIPFLMAFIWFAIRLSNDYRNDIKTRDNSWMEFLAAERIQRKDAMAQGLEKVKEITECMLKLSDSIAKHDVSALERHRLLKELIEDK